MTSCVALLQLHMSATAQSIAAPVQAPLLEKYDAVAAWYERMSQHYASCLKGPVLPSLRHKAENAACSYLVSMAGSLQRCCIAQSMQTPS